MVAEVQLITAREFASWPEQKVPTELIGGEIVVSPAPTPEHQNILFNLGVFLRQVAEERQFGRWYIAPLDLFVTGYDVLQPDLILFAPEEIPTGREQPIEKIPLIVIEVLSPSTRSNDLRAKLPRYASRGIAEFWVVDPVTQAVTIHALSEFGTYRAHILGQGPIDVGVYEGVVFPYSEIFAK